MKHDVVKSFVPGRYGFIEERTTDVPLFFLSSAVVAARRLRPGDTVSYEIQPGRNRRPRATKVTITEENSHGGS